MQQPEEPASAVPRGFCAYKRTPEFSAATVPAGLLRDHSTKSGVWGRVRVVEGHLLYVVEDPARLRSSKRITPDAPGIIEPEILHRVELQGPVRFYVEFFRAGTI